MLLLGLDTAGQTLSVALAENGEVQSRRTCTDRRGQSEALLPLVESCLQETGHILRDITAIAVVTGPGSFTGLRLGLAAAQGLGRALTCPVGGFDRFQLLRTWAARDKLAIVLDSLRAELFAELQPGTPEMLAPDQIAARLDSSWTLLGDGAPQVPGTFPLLESPPGADLAAQAATVHLQRGLSLPPAIPFYLREPDVTVGKALN